MRKSELQKLLNGVEGDPEIVLRASATSLTPVEDLIPVQTLYRPSYGLYRQINNDDDFTEAQKAEEQIVILLRS